MQLFLSSVDNYITCSMLQFKKIYEVEIKEIQDGFEGYNQPTKSLNSCANVLHAKTPPQALACHCALS